MLLSQDWQFIACWMSSLAAAKEILSLRAFPLQQSSCKIIRVMRLWLSAEGRPQPSPQLVSLQDWDLLGWVGKRADLMLQHL